MKRKIILVFIIMILPLFLSGCTTLEDSNNIQYKEGKITDVVYFAMHFNEQVLVSFNDTSWIKFFYNQEQSYSELVKLKGENVNITYRVISEYQNEYLSVKVI